MIKNYFKITFRNLWRNKGFSAINIFWSCYRYGQCHLILLWIKNKMSIERFHKMEIGSI